MSEAPAAAPFLRRQLVLAVVAGAVVLVAVAVVAAAVAGGTEQVAHAALRPAPDGSGVTTVSPLARGSHTAVWVAGAALLAVAAVLAVALDQLWRVARFALGGGAGDPREDA